MRTILLIIIGYSLSFSHTVIDTKTGLMWQDNSDAKSIKRDWEGAKTYCKALTLEGYSDWFLPSHEQLESIIDFTRYKPATKIEFKYTVSSNYWSSTGDADSSYDAWYVNFKYGLSYNKSKGGNVYVRCARIGHSDTLNFDLLTSTLIAQELSAIKKPPKKVKLLRDEFESTKEFNLRVKSENTKEKAMLDAYKIAYAKVKVGLTKRSIKKALEMTWGKPHLLDLKYDADKGSFIATVGFEKNLKFSKKVVIKIERDEARSFKKQLDQLKIEAIFDYDGKDASLKNIRIHHNDKAYTGTFSK